MPLRWNGLLRAPWRSVEQLQDCSVFSGAQDKLRLVCLCLECCPGRREGVAKQWLGSFPQNSGLAEKRAGLVERAELKRQSWVGVAGRCSPGAAQSPEGWGDPYQELQIEAMLKSQITELFSVFTISFQMLRWAHLPRCTNLGKKKKRTMLFAAGWGS